MKPIKSKHELRNELDQQMADYLGSGGKVSQVPRGVSGRPQATGPLTPVFTPREPTENRTLVTEVVAAVEARRRPQPTPSTKRKHKPQPKKRIILDDFGQPLRWEWVED